MDCVPSGAPSGIYRLAGSIRSIADQRVVRRSKVFYAVTERRTVELVGLEPTTLAMP